MKFITQLLVLLTLQLPLWANAQYYCGSDLDAINADSSFMAGPRALNMTELEEAKELMILSQEKIIESLTFSREVVTELKTCFDEMNGQWTAQLGPRCQAFENFQELDYTDLVYTQLPSLYKAMRINLALAVKPPHDPLTNEPIWNWVNKDMIIGHRWPDFVVQQEPLISSLDPNNKAEQEVAVDMFFTELRTIVIDYAQRIQQMAEQREEMESQRLLLQMDDGTEAILFQMLLDALSAETPNELLTLVHKDLWQERNRKPVQRWFDYLHRRLVEFREGRLEKAMTILNMFRPMGQLGNAHPLPHQLSDVLAGTLVYNQESIDRVNGDINEFSAMTDYFRIDEKMRDFLEYTEFVQATVDEHNQYCDMANLLHFRKQIYERNNMIGTIVVGLAIGIYARILVSTAVFLGFSINEVYKAEVEAYEAEQFFMSQAIPVNSVVTLDELMNAQNNVRTSYLMIPLSFIGTPISRATAAPFQAAGRGVGNLVRLGTSRGKALFQHTSPNGQRTVFIERGQ